MKKYIITLVAMTVIGTGTISAQRMDRSHEGNRMEMREGNRGSHHNDMRGGNMRRDHRMAAPRFRGHGVPCPEPVVYVAPAPRPCPPPPAPVVVAPHHHSVAAAVVGTVAAVTLASLLAH